MTQQVYSPPQNLIAWCEINKWWLHIYMKMKVAFWVWMWYFSHLKPRLPFSNLKKGHSHLYLKMSKLAISICLTWLLYDNTITGKQKHIYTISLPAFKSPWHLCKHPHLMALKSHYFSLYAEKKVFRINSRSRWRWCMPCSQQRNVSIWVTTQQCFRASGRLYRQKHCKALLPFLYIVIFK